LILAGMAGSANALTFTETLVWSAGSPNAPSQAPTLFTTGVSDPLYTPSTFGDNLPNARSPFENNNNGLLTNATNGVYSVLSPGPSDLSNPSSATYDLTGLSSLTFLWGSPDDYNHVQFRDSSNAAVAFTNGGVGSDLNGSELTCYGANTCNRLHWVLVTFSWDKADDIGTLVLSDNGQAAFEFAMRQPERATNPTPLPAAAWLFGSVIAGGAGFSRWRKRKAKSVVA